MNQSIWFYIHFKKKKETYANLFKLVFYWFIEVRFWFIIFSMYYLALIYNAVIKSRDVTIHIPSK